MAENIYSVLEAAFNGMVEKPCWSVAVISSALETQVTLYIGDKVERKKALTAPSLSEEQRNYHAAFEVTIIDCTWRLDSTDQVVTSWSDDAETLRKYMAYLKDQPVIGWEITWPGLDLTLHFANTLALRLFCDQTDPVDGGENYAFRSPEYTFQVGVRSHITATARAFD